MKFPILLVEFLVALVEFPGRVDKIVYTVGGISAALYPSPYLGISNVRRMPVMASPPPLTPIPIPPQSPNPPTQLHSPRDV